jgi:hypothetical protein
VNEDPDSGKRLTEPSPEGGLVVVLWVLAVFVVVLEVTWWWTQRIYS